MAVTTDPGGNCGSNWIVQSVAGGTAAGTSGITHTVNVPCTGQLVFVGGILVTATGTC